jgi:hypothetical protein
MNALDCYDDTDRNAGAFSGQFPAAARQAIHEAIYRRRDVRRFRDEAIAPDVLHRILDARTRRRLSASCSPGTSSSSDRRQRGGG